MVENIPLWEATGTNPPEELWKNGYAELDVPAPAHFNYLMNQMTTRLRYLSTGLINRTGDLSTYSVAQSGSEYQSFWGSSEVNLTAVEGTDGRFILKTSSSTFTGINAKMSLYISLRDPATGAIGNPATVSVPITLECTDPVAISDISVISFSGFTPTSYTLKRLDEGTGNVVKLLLTMVLNPGSSSAIVGDCILRFGKLSSNTSVYASRPFVVYGSSFTADAYSREPLNALYKQAFKANSVPATDLNVTIANVPGNANATLGSLPYKASLITDSAKRAGLPSTGDGVVLNLNNTIGTDSTGFRGLARLAIVNDGTSTAPRLFASYLSSNFSSTTNSFVEFVNSTRLSEVLGGYVQSSNVDYLLASYAKSSALSAYVTTATASTWQKAKVTADNGKFRYEVASASSSNTLNFQLQQNPVNGIGTVQVPDTFLDGVYLPIPGNTAVTFKTGLLFTGTVMGSSTSAYLFFELFAFGQASDGNSYPVYLDGYLPKPTSPGDTTKVKVTQCYDSVDMGRILGKAVDKAYDDLKTDIKNRVSGTLLFTGATSAVNSYVNMSLSIAGYDQLEIEYQVATGNYPRTQTFSLELIRSAGNTALTISDTQMPTSTSVKSYELTLTDSTGKWTGSQLQITLNNTWDLSTKTGTTNSNGIIIKSIRGISRVK